MKICIILSSADCHHSQQHILQESYILLISSKPDFKAMMENKQNKIQYPNTMGFIRAQNTFIKTKDLRDCTKDFIFLYSVKQQPQPSFFICTCFYNRYEVRKRHYQKQGHAGMTSVFYSSIEASIIATLVTQPIWVVKTRMLLNVKPNIGEYQNVIEKCKQIYKQNGSKGFLKGVQLSLILSFSGVLQMSMYEGSKIIYDKLQIPETKFSQKNFFCGSMSKLVSVILTYPITTVRTRIQQNQFFNDRQSAKYINARDIASKLWKNEGLKGFYKGLMANMIKGIPQRGIYFYFYELFKKIFISQSHPSQ